MMISKTFAEEASMQRSSNTSDTSVPHDSARVLVNGEPRSADVSKDSLTDPRLSPRSAVPPYTPMPIPNRVSSANVKQNEQSPHADGRRTRLHQRETQGREGNGDAEADDHSLNFSGFDDDLLQPRSSISPIRSDSAARGRSRPSSPRTRTDNGTTNCDLSSIENQFPRPPMGTGPLGAARRQLDSVAGPITLGDDALLQLQTPSPDKSDIQHTELNAVDDIESWDLIVPGERVGANLYSLEKRAEQLYSPEHLRIILDDPKFLYKFSAILRKYRPWRIPVLSHYLAACKATRALEYTNSLTQLLSSLPYESSLPAPQLATNPQLQAVAKESFDALLSDDLHYYITHTWIKVVSTIVQRRITGTLPAHLLETSNG